MIDFRRPLLAALAVSLSACTTLPSTFANRLTMTLDGQRLFLTSLYGPFGLTTEIDKADVEAIRRILENRNAP